MTKQIKPPPPDPLLMSKKPIEGKPHAAGAEYTARFDPTPPPLPPSPPGSQFTTPGLLRDPVSGVRLGFQPAETDGGTYPNVKPTSNSRP